jgi:hypothetical protein
MVACLHETKLQLVNESTVFEMLGTRFRSNFSFLPIEGTCGGFLIAVSDDHFKLMSSSRSKCTLTVKVQSLMDDSEWTLTSIYGPQLEVDKIIFIKELGALWPVT